MVKNKETKEKVKEEKEEIKEETKVVEEVKQLKEDKNKVKEELEKKKVKKTKKGKNLIETLDEILGISGNNGIGAERSPEFMSLEDPFGKGLSVLEMKSEKDKKDEVPDYLKY